MTTTEELPIAATCLTADKIMRLAPELLAMRDGLTEIATGLVNAYPSETHVLRVTAPLTRSVDGLFASIARQSEDHPAIYRSVRIEQATTRRFYEWARQLRIDAAARLWMVPKPGLMGEEHLQLAQELVALQAVMSRIAQGLRRMGSDAKTVKAAHTLSGALADLNVWLGGIAWERQKFPTDYNPYTDASMHTTEPATVASMLCILSDVFDGASQGTEATS